ncbi:MAG: hypothetical protein UHD09_00020 [Bifidobacterium sp.]|nr:hypothetical protein [Bifidobacterium sp.]
MADNANAPTKTRRVGTAGRARIVVIVAAVVVVLALVSAFGWPGWAVRTAPEPTPVSTSIASGKPTVQAKALPGDASNLLKAMPATVGTYARVDTATTDAWSDAKPLEEYVVTYSTGDDATQVRVTVGQWSDADGASDQYSALTKALKGKQLASGAIKVSGEATGSYEIVQDDGDDAKATSVWRNDTVCFQMTGPTDAVETLTKIFPV